MVGVSESRVCTPEESSQAAAAALTLARKEGAVVFTSAPGAASLRSVWLHSGIEKRLWKDTVNAYLPKGSDSAASICLVSQFAAQ